MPIVLVVVAVVLFMAAYNDNLPALGRQLETDVAGWAKWGLAIAVIGALGKIPKFEKPAWALLVLVFVVLIFSNHSALFANLQNLSIVPPGTAPTTPAAATPPPAPGPGVELTGAATGTSSAGIQGSAATSTGSNTGPLGMLGTLGADFGGSSAASSIFSSFGF